MGEKAPETLEERLSQATDKLRTARENFDDVGTREQLDAIHTILREALLQGSREDREKLSDEVQRVSDTLGNITTEKERVDMIYNLIGQIRQDLTALKSDVEEGQKEEGKKGFFEKLFTGGFTFDTVATSIAFSMGSILKSAKESGFQWADMLKPFMWLVGENRIEIASALADQGFESIDGEGKLGMVIAVKKAQFASMPIEEFAAKLAVKARERFPSDKKISYKQLAELAKELQAPAAAAQPTPAGPERVPEVTQGDVLKQAVMVAPGLSLVVRGDIFEFKLGNTLKKFRMYNAEGGTVEAVTSAVVGADGNLALSLSVPVDNVYTGIIRKQDFQNIATKLGANQAIDTKVPMKVQNGASYTFEFVTE